jgi:Xaa-Pro dipeptidase
VSATSSSDSPLLSPEGVAAVRAALADAGVDGWLLFEFHGQNPIAAALTGLGWNTRRSFVLVPREGDPVALVHAIEGSSWRHWPWEKRRYAGWRQMEEELVRLLDGVGRVAMEVSPRSAVPTLDRVPSGIVELVRGCGVEVVGSGDLVSTFHARWTMEQLAGHRRSAALLQEVARSAFRRAAEAVEAGTPLTEGGLSRWILETLARSGHAVETDCIVAIGPRAADPHYQPAGDGEPIGRGDVLLIDLWGKPSDDAVPADQTWMAILDSTVPDRVQRVWEAVRDARDGALVFLRERHAAGSEVRGYEVDDVAREVIRGRGFGDFFVHRTGHSIDRGLHGSGPNLDNLETRDDRRLVHGVGFSVEPGIYLPGELGVRTEVDVHWSAAGPEVTTPDPQREIFRLFEAW